MNNHHYKISSLSCQGCVNKLTKILLEIDNVEKINVDLETKIVSITGGHDGCIEKKLNENNYIFSKEAPSAETSKPLQAKTEIISNIKPKQSRIKIETESITIFLVKDMTCSSCVNKIEKSIGSQKGVSSTQVNLVEKTVSVNGNFDQNIILKSFNQLGYPAKVISSNDNSTPISITLNIENMTCSSCVAKIEKNIKARSGAQEVQVNLIDKTALITGDIHLAEVIA